MIQLHGIHKRYATGQDALNAVSFSIHSGEIAFITGHSGAGKSTLLKLIALIERPSKGQIVVDNVNLSTIQRKQIPYHRRQIGSIFQNNMLLANRSVFDNVALALEVSGVSRHDISKRVPAALEKVKLLKQAKKYPNQLSIGEQQRVGIARAVVNKPIIILADEPTGNLDPELSLEIMQLFVQFKQLGTTVLIASHDVGLIKSLACRTLTLEQGHLITDSAA